VHICSLNWATQLGHLLLLLGRQKIKARPQAPTENQFSWEEGKRHVKVYPVLKPCVAPWDPYSYRDALIRCVSQLVSQHFQVSGELCWVTSLAAQCLGAITSLCLCLHLTFPKPRVLPRAWTWPGQQQPQHYNGRALRSINAVAAARRWKM